MSSVMVLYTSLLALLAQLVEQLTLNQRVEGSSPSRRTTHPHTSVCGFFRASVGISGYIDCGIVIVWYIGVERISIDQYL